MDLYTALIERRTVFHYAEREIPRDVVERALEAARFAPNHKLTEPWRFTLVGPQTRMALADIARRLALPKCEGLSEEESAQQLERAARKLSAVPCLVAVSQVRTPDDALREREDYAATSLALHQFVLSLWADGVGAQWGTGAVTRDEEAYRVLGIDPAVEVIIGFVKAGYPAKIPATRRRPWTEVTRELP